jgi:hypothetical protein
MKMIVMDRQPSVAGKSPRPPLHRLTQGGVLVGSTLARKSAGQRSWWTSWRRAKGFRSSQQVSMVLIGRKTTIHRRPHRMAVPAGTLKTVAHGLDGSGVLLIPPPQGSIEGGGFGRRAGEATADGNSTA